MHQSKLKRISLGVLLAFLPLAANAAGLGKLNVLSGLGEPLSAEIEVLSASAEELAGLTAAIAPDEAYSLQGIERPALHSTIRVEVKKKTDGSPILKLTSSQPITDPFLDMLVQVDWPTGRLLREFTLLLDPPGYANQGQSNVNSPVINTQPAAKPAVTTESATSNANANTSVSERPATKRSKKTASLPSERKPLPAPASTEGKTLTTAPGDTLSSIAKQEQVDGVNLDQLLIGIYRANQDAFIRENINRLKVGQLIRIPTQAELQAIPKSEAAEEVRVHTVDWKAYRSKLAGAVAESAPAEKDVVNNQSARGKITAKAEDKAAPAPTGPRDVVKLSKNDTATDNISAADAKSLQDKISALKEDATARENSIKEANDRASALEKQIQDMQKLLALKNQAAADMQKNAAQTAEPPPAEPAKPAAEAPKEAVPEPEVKAAEPVKKPEPKKLPVPVAPPVPVAEPGILDAVEDIDPVVVGGGGGVIALLLGGWLYLRNKRRRGLDGFEKSILTSGGLKANTVFGNTLGGSVDTGDTSFLTDFSQSSGGMIDTNDVDPIAEAEVYMAYGRDRQAEEILRDAISKEPTRYELHLKLLDVYASRNDPSAFEALAGEIYTSLGTSDPVWAKVAELGRKVEPDNPLYQVSETPVAAGTFEATNSRLTADDFSTVEPVSKPALDFSVDGDAPLELEGADQNVAVVEEEATLDFDLGLGDEVAAAEDAGIEELDQTVSFDTPQVADNETELDFQLDVDGSDAASDVQEDISVDFSTATSEPTLSLDDEPVESQSESTLQFDAADVSSEASSDATLDFDISDFGAKDFEEKSDTVAEIKDAGIIESASSELSADDFATAFESAAPEISFDLPDATTNTLDISTEDISAGLAAASITSLVAGAEASEVDFNLDAQLGDFDKTMIIKPDATVAEDIVFDAVPDSDNSLDLDFDIDLGGSEPVVAESVQASAPEIDLSGISFDLDGDEADNEVKEADPTDLDVSPKESSEVDTKLDLVTAYIDMGDSEGAKELLEEVLKEGGPQQRLKASDLLKGLS